MNERRRKMKTAILVAATLAAEDVAAATPAAIAKKPAR
jgi:hypothetical protein